MNKYLLIVSSLALAAPLAWAQAPAPAAPADPATSATPAKPDAKKIKEDFAMMDANKDGKLSKEEAAGNGTIDFAAFDRNADGNISRGEYESGVKAKSPG